MSQQDPPPDPPENDPPDPPEPPDEGDSEEVKALKTALAAARKDRVEARKALDELKAAQMSESEKAVSAARDEGYAKGRAEAAIDKAEARFRSLATGKVAELDTLISHIDMTRFVDEGEVNEEAIKSAVEAFAKVAPATTPPAYQTVRKGPGDGAPTPTADFIRSVMPH